MVLRTVFVMVKIHRGMEKDDTKVLLVCKFKLLCTKNIECRFAKERGALFNLRIYTGGPLLIYLPTIGVIYLTFIRTYQEALLFSFCR